jgi:hypothetical protein
MTAWSMVMNMMRATAGDGEAVASQCVLPPVGRTRPRLDADHPCAGDVDAVTAVNPSR